ncbi:MAG: hypothetical protein KAS04_02365 [Candidatus Aenigmarchaeota archaeon]|nr:hypothetical protein [Candidatus Aenigmarchaeota archaeon]
MGKILLPHLKCKGQPKEYKTIKIYTAELADHPDFGMLSYNAVIQLAKEHGLKTPENNTFGIPEPGAIKSVKWLYLENNDDAIADNYLKNVTNLICGTLPIFRPQLDDKEIHVTEFSDYSWTLLVNAFELAQKGLTKQLKGKFKRYSLAIDRFATSYKREDELDAVLDCCSVIESLYGVGDELRLRIALITFQLFDREKDDYMKSIYELYGIRNNFIHGNTIPIVSISQIRKYQKIISDILHIPLINSDFIDFNKINESILEIKS